MLRLPLLALALAVLAAASASLAHADDAAPAGASVTIAPSDGGAARTLDLAALADRFDVHGVSYTVREADGTKTTTTVAEGISLNALLMAAGLDADAFTYIEIPRPDGSSTLVTADDVGGTDEGPPVVWSDEQGTHFLRPSNGEGDTNAADLVTLPEGTLSLSLRTGEPLQPRIAVTRLRARPGQSIGFSASLVGGAALGHGLEYRWYFADGGTVRGANVSHKFRDRGIYLVHLNVVRGEEVIGLPDLVSVRILPPHRDRRSGDAHRSDESQDSSGDGGGGTGDETGGGTGTGGSGASAPAYVAPVSPPAASPSPAPAPAPAPRHVPAPRRPRGDLVSGTLIASASAASTPVGGGHAASAAAHGATSDGPLHLPIGIWVGAGLVLLLALGWVLESRHTLPFWQP